MNFYLSQLFFFLTIGIFYAAFGQDQNNYSPQRTICSGTNYTYSFPSVNKTGATFMRMAQGNFQLFVAYQGQLFFFNSNNVTFDLLTNKSAVTTWKVSQAPLASPNDVGGLSLASFGNAMDFDPTTGILAVGQPAFFDLVNGVTKGRVLILTQGASSTNGTTNSSVAYSISAQLEDFNTADKAGFSQFGASLELQENSIIVGSPGCCGSLRTGGAYVFYYSAANMTWIQQQEGGLPFGIGYPRNSLIGTAVRLGIGYIFVTTPVLDVSTGANFTIDVPNVGTVLAFNGFDPQSGDFSIPLNTPSEYDINFDVFPPTSNWPDAQCGTVMSKMNMGNGRILLGCPGYRNGTGLVLIGRQIGDSFSYENIIDPTNYPTINTTISSSGYGFGFGSAVDLNNQNVIVGTTKGVVYIFERIVVPLKKDNYVLTATLTGNTHGFGGDVKISADSVFVADYIGGTVTVYYCSSSTTLSISLLFVMISFVFFAVFAM